MVDAVKRSRAPRLWSSIVSESRFKGFAAEFCRSKTAAAALALLISIIFIAMFAPWVAPQNPFDLAALDLNDSLLPPRSPLANGGIAWLGTDVLGRDMLSAIVYGIRISLQVALLSAGVALIVGLPLGLLAGYSGGRIDALIMRIVDVQLSFPPILIGLVLIAVAGSGIDKVIIALATVQWAYYARTVRSSAQVERRQEYIDACRSLALGIPRIIFRHLAPNCMPMLVVVLTVQLAHSIALEASLSFLGVGLPVTEPSLGQLIANGFEYVMGGEYWVSVYPGLSLLLLIAAINMVGDRLRDVLNPRLGH